MVSTITKEELRKLPQEAFTGKIVLVQTLDEAVNACQYLEKHEVLGFDTETRPAFAKGVINKIALMQLSTNEKCFLFRINNIHFPDCLLCILKNPDIKKIGLSLRDDFSAIRKRDKQFVAVNFVELQIFVKKYGIEDEGLQRIYGILFGKRISKGQRLTNWEAETLTENQKMYAALDAWACLRIYDLLLTKEEIG